MRKKVIFISLATIIPIILTILIANYAAHQIDHPSPSLNALIAEVKQCPDKVQTEILDILQAKNRDSQIVLSLFTKFVIVGFILSIVNGLFMYLALKDSKKNVSDPTTLI